MDEFSTTSDTLDQADEDILTYTASDEAHWSWLQRAAWGRFAPIPETSALGWMMSLGWMMRHWRLQRAAWGGFII
jgi:hypothetical protein